MGSGSSTLLPLPLAAVEFPVIEENEEEEEEDDTVPVVLLHPPLYNSPAMATA